MSSKRILLILSIFLVFTMLISACNAAETVVEEPATEEPTAEEPTQPSEEEPAEEDTAEEEAAEEDTAEEEAEVEEVTLTILHNWGPDDAKGPIFQSIAEEFMAQNPDIVIEQEIIPDEEIFTKVEVSFVGGEESDLVFQNYFGPSLAWVDDGVTIPVTDYLTEWGLEKYYIDAALAQYTRSDGEVAAFPLEGFNWPIWYNTAIFEEAGVDIPTTSEEMIEVAEAIRAAGYEPFAIGGSDWTGARLHQMFMVSGLSEAETQELLANGGFTESESALAAMQAFVEWRDSGVFAENAEGLEFSSMNELFFSGQAAMMHGGSWSYAEAPEDLMPVIELGGLPVTDLGAFDQPTAWAGFSAKGIHITRNGSQKMDAVERFVTFFMQPENMVKFVEETGMVPPYKNLDVDESALNPLFVKSLSLPESITYVIPAELVIPGPVIELWDKVAFDAFIPNGMSAEEILAALDEVYAQSQ